MRCWAPASQARGGWLWLAGYRPTPTYLWGERAYALARYGHGHGSYGALPADLAAERPRAPDPPPWMSDTCSVCLEAYTDPWPSGDELSRAPAGRWVCGVHAVCMACDIDVEFSANPRCPLCRAARA